MTDICTLRALRDGLNGLMKIDPHLADRPIFLIDEAGARVNVRNISIIMENEGGKSFAAIHVPADRNITPIKPRHGV